MNSQNVETGREELHFFYDSQSRPAFMEYDGAMYRYVHNLQGDIVAILDAAGNAVVEYKYDAWGKLVGVVVETGIGAINPFRYRGYVWDVETELYYLRSRFYNAKISRFINSDTLICSALIPLSCNVYSYCRNNSVLNYDSEGLEPHSINTIPKDKITVEKIVDESDLGYGYTCVVEEYRVWIPFDMIDKVITDYVLDDKEGLAEDFQFVVEDIVLPYASSKNTSIGTITEFSNTYMTVVALCEMIRKRILTDAAKKARNEAKEKETGVVYIVRTTTVKGGRPIVPVTYESMEEWYAMMKKTVETR